MKSKRIFLSAGFIGPRLRYVAKEIFERRLGLSLVFAGESQPEPSDLVIIYGNGPGVFHIPACGILSENQNLNFEFPWKKEELTSTPKLREGVLSIDIFGIVFWCLSRYEEYALPIPKDEHGRFPSSQSLMHKLEILEFPLVDHLIFHFAQILKTKGVSTNLIQPELEFSFDLDNPTAYSQKGVWRTFAGFSKDLLHLKFKKIAERFSVLIGTKKDPFDNFSQMIKETQNLREKPSFFIWTGDYGTYDKGLNWNSEFFRKTVSELSKSFNLGLHPSYSSFKNKAKLKTEMDRFKEMLDFVPTKNRFHFLRFSLPQSYLDLINLGFTADYSMGYADQFGYRAGTGHSFKWYNLSAESETNFEIHPFALMDSTAHFKLKLEGNEFMEKCLVFIANAELCKGKVNIVLHNEHYAWKGWEKLVIWLTDKVEKTIRRQES